MKAVGFVCLNQNFFGVTGGGMRSEPFDDGKGIQQDGPSISSLLPGLLEGSVKRKPGTTRSGPSKFRYPCSFHSLCDYNSRYSGP